MEFHISHARAMYTLTDSPLQTIDELGLEGSSEADWSSAKMLCQLLKPFQIVTDYLRGEKYPTLGSLSCKITQLTLYLSRPSLLSPGDC